MIDRLLARLESMARSALLALPNLAVGVVVLLVFWLVSRLLARLVRSVVARAGRPRGVQVVLGRLTGWVVLALGLLVALAVVFPTVTAASVFGALGIGSVAIGFAFKDILQNLLAGILILLTRPFRIGDQIVSGAHEGTVEDIAVRSTSACGPTTTAASSSRTASSTPTASPSTPRTRTAGSPSTSGSATATTSTPPSRIVLDTIADLDGVVADPAPTVLVTALGDFAVNLQVRFWIDPPARKEAVEVADQVLTALKPALIAAGIDLPLPTSQVLLHDQTEPADGDRTRQREGWPPDPTSRSDLPTSNPTRKAPTA